MGTALDRLEPRQAAIFCTCVGDLIYYATDRYDLLFAVRTLTTQMKEPTNLSLLKLKRVVKHALGTLDYQWFFY
jgi:hypothetical protein